MTGYLFFSDSAEKAIKKTSAILYKPVYAGNNKFPGIIGQDEFAAVQQMKPRIKRKNKQINKTEDDEEYELISDSNIENTFADIKRMIQTGAENSRMIRELIFGYACKKYSCIKGKEGAL